MPNVWGSFEDELLDLPKPTIEKKSKHRNIHML